MGEKIEHEEHNDLSLKGNESFINNNIVYSFKSSPFIGLRVERKR